MSNEICEYCQESLFGDWISIAEGEFCNRSHAKHWKDEHRITDLERRNGELEKDAARYQWLKSNVSERLTNKSLLNEFSEHKCEYIFPQLIAWADFCGPISFDDAIDMRIDEALTRTKEQR